MQGLWFGPIELRTLHKILLERFWRSLHAQRRALPTVRGLS